MTRTWDAKRDLDDYRARRDEFRVVQLPLRRFLMADGQGDPNTAASYGEAVGALYPAAYRLKLASKRAGHDHVVPPLEGCGGPTTWPPSRPRATRAAGRGRG